MKLTLLLTVTSRLLLWVRAVTSRPRCWNVQNEIRFSDGVWATANTNTALALSLRWMKPCKTCQYQLEKRFSIIKLKGNWTIVAAVFISVFWRELNWLVWRGRKQVHIKDPDIYEENVWHNRIKKSFDCTFFFLNWPTINLRVFPRSI